MKAAGCTEDEEERGGREERQRGGGGTHRDRRDMVALGKDSDGVVRPWPHAGGGGPWWKPSGSQEAVVKGWLSG